MAASFTTTGADMATLHSTIEFRANGEISRMRSHKGNMPSLPQNKFCSLCPAKFTRTTHLNRHLRSHTNERSHRCEVCHAEFTRSDLLTRHKRTCGDSRNVHRSRRKSCQSCAESKVKCNLQHPCSKCLSRGRECVFINDPETSRTRKAAKRPSPTRLGISINADIPFSRSSTSPLDSEQGSVVASPQSPYSMVYPSPISTASPIDSFHPSPIPNNHLENSIQFGLPSLSYSSSSSASSSRSSSRLEPFDLIPNLANLSFDGLEMNPQLDDFFQVPNHQSDTTFMNGFAGSCSPEEGTGLGSTLEGQDLCSGLGNDESFSYHQPLHTTAQNVTHGTTSLNTPSFSGSSSHVHHFATASVIDHNNNAFDSSVSAHVSEPETEELSHYLSMFFTAFSIQLPLVHRPTWTMAGKHPMLVSAMHACGAIFVRSEAAMDFVRRSLAFLRDNLISEFSKSDCSLKDRFSLIVAVVLLQSLSLLWRQPDQIAATKAFHGLLITMIRKLGLIKILNAWTPPDLSNPYALDVAWREWARYETLKRVVFLAYVQDCSDCVFLSSKPKLHPMEMEIKLPCDDALWNAENAKEWYHALHTPSPYGAGPRRLASINLRQSLSSLDVPVPPDVQAQHNPFSHFILIHTILRNIFSSHFEDGVFDSPSGSTIPDRSTRARVPDEFVLHNWLQLWTNNSDGFLSDKFDQESTQTSFISSSMPFYWLAHYSILAVQDGILDLRPATSDTEAQERCRLITSWLSLINSYLDKGYPLPSRIQDFPSNNGMQYGSQFFPSNSNSESSVAYI
ncbi:hypothetical protein FA15DRAFT_702411 [Coprinopsis marcescibilis]|uniref:Zn(2)-C6 fungal-type domain-containing protein n=1 Tax=Coprinopsis marcescibilis TaxID=230819 RepID=A0A5C3L3T7_COPMA|nr:hypothetical protein FA15DRAFT_702411 [Coprinopsis marcescibilis]